MLGTFTQSNTFIYSGGDWIPLDHARCEMTSKTLADLGIPDEGVEIEFYDLPSYTVTGRIIRPPGNVLRHKMYELRRKWEGRDKRWLRRRNREFLCRSRQ